MQAKATLADMLVAIEVDTIKDKLSVVKTKVLIHTWLLIERGRCAGAMLNRCRGGRRDAKQSGA